MTWKNYHSRGDVLRTVIATANDRCDGVLPTDVEGARDVFADDIDLLGALQLRWHTRLAGRIEQAMAAQPLDLEGAVVTAWSATRDELPGVRLVLDRAASHPTSDEMAWVSSTATAKERAMLAVMAGQAGIGDLRATPIGARIEQRARRLRPGVDRVPARREQGSLLDRLRAALAA
jgi:hypothetical protein